MKTSQFFHIDGHGYLENISYRESKCIANIKAIHQLEREEIYLDCEVQGIVEEYLLNLATEVKKGNSVIVTFKADYRRLDSNFHCIEPGSEINEDQIVVFGCKLTSLENCYINGKVVNKNYFKYLAAA